MSATKICTLINYINWILISVLGAGMLYYMINRSGHSDAAGQGLETAVLAAGIFVSFLLVDLNLLPLQRFTSYRNLII